MKLFDNIFGRKKTNLPTQIVTDPQIVNNGFITMLMLMELENAVVKYNTEIGSHLPAIIEVPKEVNEEHNKLTLELERLRKLGLEESKNYKILWEKQKALKDKIFDVESRNARNQENYKKARDLCKYVSLIKSIFGQKVVLVDRQQFKNLCKKYSLSTGFLQDYSGSIPDNNLKDIEKFLEVYNNLRDWHLSGIMNFVYNEETNKIESEYLKDIDRMTLCRTIGVKDFITYKSHNLLLNDSNTAATRSAACVLHYKVTKIINTKLYEPERYSPICNSLREYFKDNIFYNLRNHLSRHSEHSFKIDTINPAIPFRSESDSTWISFECEALNSPLMIACPEKDLSPKRNIVIENKPKDPVVYFDSPYGVVVITAWGEESEDQILKHYIEVNNLINKSIV